MLCLQARLVKDTAGMVLDRLEEVYSSIARLLWQQRRNIHRALVIQEASDALESLLQNASALQT